MCPRLFGSRVNPFKTDNNPNYMKSLISYSTVNILHFRCKNQLIFYREVVAVCSENHSAHGTAFRGQNRISEC